MAKRTLTEADHQRLERMRVNAERTRGLAEKAKAELDRRKQQHASVDPTLACASVPE